MVEKARKALINGLWDLEPFQESELGEEREIRWAGIG
jgi:hypothetical protein